MIALVLGEMLFLIESGSKPNVVFSISAKTGLAFTKRVEFVILATSY